MSCHILPRPSIRRPPRNRELEGAEKTLRVEMPTWVTCPERLHQPARTERLLTDQQVHPIFF
jgi:hypothetical protein